MTLEEKIQQFNTLCSQAKALHQEIMDEALKSGKRALETGDGDKWYFSPNRFDLARDIRQAWIRIGPIRRFLP